MRVIISIRDTEIAIKQIKDSFERRLAEELNLTRVSAPLFVQPRLGLNDNLSGVERPVAFDVKGLGGERVEIVHSLAKWKRMALKRYGFNNGEGLYADMNAIRRDEDLDSIHSVYVDQWDWERIIDKSERTQDTLQNVVRRIFTAFKAVEDEVSKACGIKPTLPDEISFVSSQELEDTYPSLTPKERENAACKRMKAVFLSQIGKELRSGKVHDGRAPDYDDWDLNGDILFWYEPLQMALEISSMGIRVDEDSLLTQVEKCGCTERLQFEYHKNVLSGNYPYTIGGGIGQSRICMFFLRKRHIGEVQAAVWPEDMQKNCAELGIELL